jgi:asparagine synthase (glutamine-hydrolysing)
MGLLGAFAFAIWDPNRRELRCARDHFGEKPLYYCYLPGRLFAFASEIKALWALTEVPDDINDLEIARHLLVPVEDDMGATYYRHIRRLPAGYRLVVTASRLEEKAYWTLDQAPPVSLRTHNDYVDAVRETFLEAVKCRTRARGPIASMLSGGLDSSSVTCVTARLLATQADSRRLRTLSAVYPTIPASDERPHIEKILDAYNLQCAYFRADNVSPIADLELLNWHGDAANKAGNLYLNWRLYRTAAAAGARVVLDGYDGDSTLSHGQGWVIELARTHHWWALSREMKAMVGERWARAVFSCLRAYGIPLWLQRLRAFYKGAAGSPPTNGRHVWRDGLSPKFGEAISGLVVPTQPSPQNDREYHQRLMNRPVLIQARDWLDAIAAEAGVEVRCPFFDVRLVSLCVGLPGWMKLSGGWPRWVMREAMAGILPDEIRWRRQKADLEPGFSNALRCHLKNGLDLRVAAAQSRVSRYLDLAVYAQLHDRFIAGTTSPGESLRYWRMHSLALWLARNNGASAMKPPAYALSMADIPISSQ